MKFNLGDIVYHKATNKKCVVSEFGDSERVFVTTEDDEKKCYREYELISEAEWEGKTVNAFSE